MKAGKTLIAWLLDRSGSMGTIKSYVIEGFNGFIREQKKEPGELIFTLVQFDENNGELSYERIYDFKNIQEVVELTNEVYQPRGSTPLNDAWVKLIQEVGSKLALMKEEDRPEKVLLVSMTDGEENASKEFSPRLGGNEFIARLVKEQEEKYNWKFLYMGANQDAKAEGLKRGASNYMNYKASGQSVNSAFNSLSSNVTRYRSASEDASFDLQEDV